MQSGIVSQNSSFWQGHPDVAYFKGYFYVVFRESQQHRETGLTRIMLAKSKTGLKYHHPICISESSDRYNCPRLSILDNQLYIICDQILQSKDYIGSENDESKTRIYFWKSDDGTNWSNPILTPITGIVPDRIVKTPFGPVLGTHIAQKEYSTHLVQNLWILTGGEWKKQLVASSLQFNFCEGSFCATDKGLICLMRENSGRGEPAYWTISHDWGYNWTKPVPTPLFGCHRPVLGRLPSGRYLTTYREQSFSSSPGFWGKNTFACLTTAYSMLDKMNPCKQSVLLPLDHDKSSHSDSGYTGWVEVDGLIYVVNYITKDAPKPYIKWYIFDEREF